MLPGATENRGFIATFPTVHGCDGITEFLSLALQCARAAGGREALDHVIGYRDEEDCEERCGQHSAYHRRPHDASGDRA
jgi:hypothetical protein